MTRQTNPVRVVKYAHPKFLSMTAILMMIASSSAFAQSITCEDHTGRRTQLSGSACPFGLKPVAVAPPPEAPKPQTSAPAPVPAQRPAQAPTVTQPDAPEKTAFLRRSKEEMTVIQEALKSLGFPVPQVDGSYGSSTDNAIRAWQRSKGVTQTGYLTPDQVEAVKLQATQAANVSPGTTLPIAPSVVNLVNKYTPTVGAELATQLLVGDSRDLIFLFNETDSAPNGVRGLTGKITFNNNTVRMCMLGESTVPEAFIDWVKIEWVRQGVTVENFNLSTARCQIVATTLRDKVAAYDVFAIERRLLTTAASLGTQTLDELAQLIQRKTLGFHSVSEWSPFEVYQKVRTAEAEKNLRALKRGNLEGYGLAVINPEKDTVCGSDAEDKNLLNQLAGEMVSSFVDPTVRSKKRFELQQGTAEAIFVSAKRKNCGFLIGDAAYLKPIIEGLERDGTKISMAPLWMRQEKVDLILKDMQSRMKTLEQRKQEESRLADETARRAAEEESIKRERQDKLDAARKTNDEQVRRDELARLRKLVQSRGQTVVESFHAQIRQHLSGVTKMDGWLPFVTWQLDRVKEGWAFGDSKAMIEDYGLAKWRSRSVEALSVKIEFAMLNRHIGERQTECWQFVWINDEEYNFQRQIIAVPCSKYEAAFKDWTAANLFISQWKL